jgi:hypothetical protein
MLRVDRLSKRYGERVAVSAISFNIAQCETVGLLGWLQDASRYLRRRWAVDGLDGVTWRGLPFNAAVLPTVVLIDSRPVAPRPTDYWEEPDAAARRCSTPGT